MKYTRKEGGRIHIGPARHVKEMATKGKLAAVWLNNGDIFDFVLWRLGYCPIRKPWRAV